MASTAVSFWLLYMCNSFYICFIYGLLHGTVSSSDYIASNDGMIYNELGKDVKWAVVLLVCICTNCRKPKGKASVTADGLWTKTWASDPQNIKHRCHPLDHEVVRVPYRIYSYIHHCSIAWQPFQAPAITMWWVCEFRDQSASMAVWVPYLVQWQQTTECWSKEYIFIRLPQKISN